jgi:hypothetical protein
MAATPSLTERVDPANLVSIEALPAALRPRLAALEGVWTDPRRFRWHQVAWRLDLASHRGTCRYP